MEHIVGEQVGVAVSGTLYYVPFKEFERVRSLNASAVEKAALFATLCRLNTLYMIANAGSGHIGSSFSSLDIISWLQLNEVRVPGESDVDAAHDLFFSSKGHDSPGLYSVLIGLGKLEFDLIHKLRRLGGLPGHPDISTPSIVTNTGSLGMGISKAKGIIFANRLNGRPGNVFVMTGDGELQEGQFWESLISAANSNLHELTVIVDHNKLQSDTLVSKVSDLGDLESKLTAFGWHVSRCDGNDIEAFARSIAESRAITDKPKIIIADTIKGKGVSFMEHTAIDNDAELYKFHSGAPTVDGYVSAAQELIDAANAGLDAVSTAPLELETVTHSAITPPEKPQRLIPAYSEALVKLARNNSNIVALDADLILDTGLIPFKKEFPDRFVECGIAEQDMVSQAGGMALRGLIPVVHSFACFLSTRPNEQIYNNATEGKKIVYVGSLAGVVPGGPGHSHQAVRDISALGANPGLTLVEPCCEAEVGMLLEWCINQNPGSSYLRLVSLPWVVPYDLPAGYTPKPGRGVALVQGTDAAIIAYGPVLLSSAVTAAKKMKQEHGMSVKVINVPWLNCIDADWLADEISPCKVIVSMDNHYLNGGQGDRIAEALVDGNMCEKSFHRFGIDKVPVCGTNQEVLAEHGLDENSIYRSLISLLGRSNSETPKQ
jgi:transketolase